MNPLKRTLVWVVMLAVVGAILLVIVQQTLDTSSGRAERRRRTAASARRALAVVGEVRHGDGSPAAGADVTVLWRTRAGEPGRTNVRAGADGGYVVAGLAGLGDGGRITGVQARLGPLFAQAAPEELPPPGERAELDFDLPPAFRIAGLVQRVEDRVPVAGAELRCGDVTAVADEAGAFELNDLAAGVLRDEGLSVIVTAEGRGKLTWAVPRDLLPPQYEDVLLLMLPPSDE